MPSQFVIEGGKPLGGEVTIQGSKNTVLPLIAACLLTEETCVLRNVPEISDVATMSAIAEDLGAEIHWDGTRQELTISCRHLRHAAPDAALSRKLRGAILFAGALLGRMREAAMPYPGGDAIGARPLGTHLRALEELGVKVETETRVLMDGRAMHGADVTLEEASVTATENTILASVLTPGKTTIRLAALEPHVQELVAFLTKLGAELNWRDFNTLEIEGVRRLGGAVYSVNFDELEISSFAALAAATRSAITLRGIEPQYLDAVFLQLKKMGVAFERDGTRLSILKPAASYRSFRLQAGLYPKLASDHLPPFAVLATQAEGTSLIHDWLYEDRLRYLRELQRMGANCTILDPHRALITGPTKLLSASIESPDIRSGMTLLIAALVAEGRSVISKIEHIERGYARLDERLRALGADILRINDEVNPVTTRPLPR